MKRCIVVFFALIASPQASAQNIYRSVDANGKVVYSTKPSSNEAAPASLPTVTRENLKAKIEQIKSNTPITCEDHGGINCAAKADGDGSVICLDGFRDAVPRFNFYCLLS